MLSLSDNVPVYSPIHKMKSLIDMFQDVSTVLLPSLIGIYGVVAMVILMKKKQKRQFFKIAAIATILTVIAYLIIYLTFLFASLPKTQPVQQPQNFLIHSPFAIDYRWLCGVFVVLVTIIVQQLITQSSFILITLTFIFCLFMFYWKKNLTTVQDYKFNTIN